MRISARNSETNFQRGSVSVSLTFLINLDVIGGTNFCPYLQAKILRRKIRNFLYFRRALIPRYPTDGTSLYFIIFQTHIMKNIWVMNHLEYILLKKCFCNKIGFFGSVRNFPVKYNFFLSSPCHQMNLHLISGHSPSTVQRYDSENSEEPFQLDEKTSHILPLIHRIRGAFL